jgi:hypothetical protein
VTVAGQAGDVLALLAFAVAPATAQFVLDTAAESYRRLGTGDPAGAIDGWLEGAFDPGYRELLDRALPGAFEQAVRDADAPFGVEVPSLQAWPRGPDDVRRVAQPALAVRGADGTWPGFRETQAALCSWLPRGEALVVPGATHLRFGAGRRGPLRVWEDVHNMPDVLAFRWGVDSLPP